MIGDWGLENTEMPGRRSPQIAADLDINPGNLRLSASYTVLTSITMEETP